MWLIFRIIINLYHKLFRLLYYPLYLLSRRAFGLAVLGGIAYLLWPVLFDKEPTATRSEPSGQAASGVVQSPTQFEDGNSRFASDLLPQMNAQELQYYSRVYYHVMDHQPAGSAYSWNYGNSHGSITPGEVFLNNYQHACRRFSEILKVGQTQQTLEGIACEKEHGGWCKLGRSFTPVCGLKAKGQGVLEQIGDLF